MAAKLPPPVVIILNRGPALEPIQWTHHQPERAENNAKVLAWTHRATVRDLERIDSGGRILYIDASDYYTKDRETN
jgi:hypothetical protein